MCSQNLCGNFFTFYFYSWLFWYNYFDLLNSFCSFALTSLTCTIYTSVQFNYTHIVHSARTKSSSFCLLTAAPPPQQQSLLLSLFSFFFRKNKVFELNSKRFILWECHMQKLKCKLFLYLGVCPKKNTIDKFTNCSFKSNADSGS